MTLPGFAIASLSDLKAIPVNARFTGLARLVVTTASSPWWYIFDENNNDTPDDDLIVLPDDNPNTGRYLKVGVISSSSGGSGGQYVSLDTDQEIDDIKHFKDRVETSQYYLITNISYSSTGKPILAVYDRYNYTNDSNGKPNYLFSIGDYGRLAWSDGQSEVDTFLYRKDVEELGTNSSLVVDKQLTVYGNIDFQGEYQADINLAEYRQISINNGSIIFQSPSNTYPTVKLRSNGVLEWGDGTSSPDAYIKRLSNGYLETGKFSISEFKTSLYPSYTSTTPGTPGEVKFSEDAIYVCVAQDTWKKADLVSF